MNAPQTIPNPVAVIPTDRIFPTGRGQGHTHALALSDGRSNPAPHAGQPYATITGGEIARMVQNPPAAVPKDQAQWFIPSTYSAFDARNHEAQRSKGSFFWLTLDVDENNLALSDVAEALGRALGPCRFLIYSTSSATLERRKWRALVPLKVALPGADFQDTQRAFYELLSDASQGALIADDALSRAGQPVYLPNPLSGFYDKLINKDAPQLDLSPLHPVIIRREGNRAKLAEAERAAEARRKQREAERAARSFDQGETPIEAFNARHSVGDLLERYGYTRAGHGNDWRSPNQTGKSFATRDMGDYWVSLSGSDANAGLGHETRSGARHGDAFDLYCHFDHGGDTTKAAREYMAELKPQGFVWPPGAGQSSAGPQDARTAPPEAREGPSGGEGNASQGIGSARVSAPVSFKLVHISDMRFSEPEFLVDDLLETSALALAFGDPGCGKSFVAIDLACCIATGHKFHGREVRQGTVIYLAGEGHNGLKRRTVAWGKHTGQNPIDGPLYFSEVPARLLDAAHSTAVAAAVDTIAAAKGKPALIVVDTLARSFAGGDENATKDMNDFIASVDAMKARYPGCVVLIVHHTGHSDKQRARGSLALKGALDAEYRVEKVEGTIALSCTKMKDAPEPPPIGFALTGIDLGMTDRKGRPVTSAVLVETEAPAKRAPRLTGQPLIAMQAFADAVKDHGVTKGGEDFPVNRKCVALTDWRAACDRHQLSSGDADSSKRAAFHKAWKNLQERGVIRVLDGFAWRVEE